MSSLLQRGKMPKAMGSSQNPDHELPESNYRRALVNHSAGAMPAETYQYDIVYMKFKSDEAFWKSWHVVGCARASPRDSISQETATIRVVMDLPASQKLYPSAYTPGFAAVPKRDDVPRGSSQAQRIAEIPGLPHGYSVALDVHILEDARMMLEYQRKYRGGKVDPDYHWLQDIIEKHDASSGKGAVVPLERPEVFLSDLKTFSDLYGVDLKGAHVVNGRKALKEETELIKVLDDTEPSVTAWPVRSEPAKKTNEVDQLEKELARVLERTSFGEEARS